MLVARKKELFDNVIPSSNSIMAENLYALATIADRADYQEIADNMLSKMSKLLLADVQWVTNWAAIYCTRATPTAEVVIVGQDADAMRKDFDRFLCRTKLSWEQKLHPRCRFCKTGVRLMRKRQSTFAITKPASCP